MFNPQKHDSRYFPANKIHNLHGSKHLIFLSYIYKTSFHRYKDPSKCNITYSGYHLEKNNVNNYDSVRFLPPPPGVPCIALYRSHYQYTVTSKMKNQVLKKSLGKRGDPLPINQVTKNDASSLRKGLHV